MIQVEPTTPVDPRCSSRLFRRVLESCSVTPTVNQCESKHDMRNIKQVSDRPQQTYLSATLARYLSVGAEIPLNPHPSQVNQDSNTYGPANQDTFNERYHQL